jgi:hypothetical protein
VQAFIVRNRFSLAASVVLLALAYGAFAVWQSRIALADHQRAEAASARIRSILEEGGERSAAAWLLQTQSTDAAALSLVNEALVHLRRVPKEFGEDYVRALILRADILITTRGDEAAVGAARSAAEAARRIARDDRLKLWAVSSLGRALDKAGHAEDLLDVTREALELSRRLAKGKDGDASVIDARTAHAKALGGVGRYDLASDELETAIRDAAAFHGEQSLEVSALRANIAAYQLKAGRIHEGLDSLARTMNLDGGSGPDSSTHSLTTRREYAQGLLLGRRASQAVPVLASIQPGMASVFGPLDVRTLEARASYALALAWTGSLSKAASAADEAIADASRSRAEATHLPWHARATIFRLQGDERAALEQEAIALKRMADNATPAERAEVLVELGVAQLLMGEQLSAERNLLESIEQLDLAHHAATPVRADAQTLLARLRLEQNRASDALALAQQADDFWRKFDADNRAGGEAALWLGRTKLALGQDQEAVEPLQRARKLLRGSPLPGDAELLKLADSR